MTTTRIAITITLLGHGMLAALAQSINLSHQNDAFLSLGESFFDNHSHHGLRNHLEVQKISLQYNMIIDVDDSTFVTFPNLTNLNLSHNQLKFAEFEARKLQCLDLSNNILDGGEFTTFPALETLCLAKNKFSDVDWNFEDSPITEIDLSDNELLRSVVIQSEHLQALGLKNVSLTKLQLKAPMLQTLDLRSSRIPSPEKQDAFYSVCQSNVNQDFKIMYLDGDWVTQFFYCSEVRTKRTGAGFAEALVKPLKCDLSTLRINVDDVVLDANDYFMIVISFYALISLIVVLSLANMTILHMYLKKSKSLRL